MDEMRQSVGNAAILSVLISVIMTAVSMVGMRSLLTFMHTPEDIFQDAFTIVWQGRRFINPDASFSAYLYTIVRNRILNQLRDLSYQDKLREQILSQAVNYTNETRDEIIANDLRQFISCALQQLTPRQREIFEMSREQQMSHREIAEVLGISVNTVQESISISLKTLRAYLEKNSIVGSDLILILICLNL